VDRLFGTIGTIGILFYFRLTVCTYTTGIANEAHLSIEGVFIARLTYGQSKPSDVILAIVFPSTFGTRRRPATTRFVILRQSINHRLSNQNMAEVAAGAGVALAAEQVISTVAYAGAAGYAVGKSVMPLKAAYTMIAHADDDSSR